MNLKKIFKLAAQWEKSPITEPITPITEPMAPITEPVSSEQPLSEDDLPPSMPSSEYPSINMSAGDLAYLYNYLNRCVEQNINPNKLNMDLINNILDYIIEYLKTQNTAQHIILEISKLQKSLSTTLEPNKIGQTISQLKTQLNDIQISLPINDNNLSVVHGYAVSCIKFDFKKLRYYDLAAREHRKAHLNRLERIINKLPK